MTSKQLLIKYTKTLYLKVSEQVQLIKSQSSEKIIIYFQQLVLAALISSRNLYPVADKGENNAPVFCQSKDIKRWCLWSMVTGYHGVINYTLMPKYTQDVR